MTEPLRRLHLRSLNWKHFDIYFRPFLRGSDKLKMDEVVLQNATAFFAALKEKRVQDAFVLLAQLRAMELDDDFMNKEENVPFLRVVVSAVRNQVWTVATDSRLPSLFLYYLKSIPWYLDCTASGVGSLILHWEKNSKKTHFVNNAAHTGIPIGLLGLLTRDPDDFQSLCVLRWTVMLYNDHVDDIPPMASNGVDNVTVYPFEYYLAVAVNWIKSWRLKYAFQILKRYRRVTLELQNHSNMCWFHWTQLMCVICACRFQRKSYTILQESLANHQCNDRIQCRVVAVMKRWGIPPEFMADPFVWSVQEHRFPETVE